MIREFTRKGTITAEENLQDALLELLVDAISGDMVLEITGLDESPEPTSLVWTQTATITLKNAAGDVHIWLDKVFTAKASVVDTSTAGTAVVGSANVTFVDGVASVTISGDAADWLDSETVTFTLADLSICGYTLATDDVVITFTTPN